MSGSCRGTYRDPDLQLFFLLCVVRVLLLVNSKTSFFVLPKKSKHRTFARIGSMLGHGGFLVEKNVGLSSFCY